MRFFFILSVGIIILGSADDFIKWQKERKDLKGDRKDGLGREGYKNGWNDVAGWEDEGLWDDEKDTVRKLEAQTHATRDSEKNKRIGGLGASLVLPISITPQMAQRRSSKYEKNEVVDQVLATNEEEMKGTEKNIWDQQEDAVNWMMEELDHGTDRLGTKNFKNGLVSVEDGMERDEEEPQKTTRIHPAENDSWSLSAGRTEMSRAKSTINGGNVDIEGSEGTTVNEKQRHQSVIKPLNGPHFSSFNNSSVSTETSSTRHLDNLDNIPQKVGELNLSSIDIAHLNELPEIKVQMFSDEDHMKFSKHNATESSWSGEDDSGGSLNLIVKKGKFYGSMSSGNKIYSITTLPNNHTIVKEIDVKDLPPDEPEHDDRFRRYLFTNSSKKLRESTPFHQTETERNLQDLDNGDIIDVMCIYTKNAMCAEAGYGNTNTCYNYQANRDPMDAKCELAIEETNVAYNNSGILTQMRLVYSGLADSTHEVLESGGLRTLLGQLRRYDGVMDHVHSWRDQYGADLVALITENDTRCGIATSFSNNPDRGFSVISRHCMTGYYSFAHETGHNMGCNHDRTNKQHENTMKYPGYNYGFCVNSKFRTIMAYPCSGRCPRLQRFSSSTITFPFEGVDSRAGSEYEDCARQINEKRKKVARFRNTKILFEENVLLAAEPMKGENKVSEADKTKDLEGAISEDEHLIGEFAKVIDGPISEVRGIKDEKQVDVEQYAKIAEVLIDLGFTPEKVEKVLTNIGD